MTETEKEERDWEFRQMLLIDAAHDEPEDSDEDYPCAWCEDERSEEPCCWCGK
jgi:hypothetical protein